MQLIEGLIQNTSEWDSFRLSHYGASEAAIMLGISPYMTRDELLKQKKTGLTPEVGEYQQKIFDKGHQIEALLRSYAEEVLEQELFPCVGVLEGTKLSASFDGLTMDGKTVFEAKTLNSTLRDILSMYDGYSDIVAGQSLPLHYQAQLEQQLLVSGAKKALFMAGALNNEGELGKYMYCEYKSAPELRQRILDGWQQFEKDLEAYQVKEAQAPIIGQSPDANNPLPVLYLQASGQLIASNLDDFKAKALSALAQVNTDLVTDQDFADAEQSVKWCKQVESMLSKAKDSLFSGAGIVLVINELEAIAQRFKTVRLQQDKTIKSKKEQIKQALIQDAQQRVANHIKALNEDLPAGYSLFAVDLSNTYPAVRTPKGYNGLAADYAAAIKGLKSLASIKNALDALVLEMIAAANAEADIRRQHSLQAVLEKETTPPPVSSSEAVLEHKLIAAQGQAHARWLISEGDINKAIYPLELTQFHDITELVDAAKTGNWPAIKQALIDHIERAIKA